MLRYAILLLDFLSHMYRNSSITLPVRTSAVTFRRVFAVVQYE